VSIGFLNVTSNPSPGNRSFVRGFAHPLQLCHPSPENAGLQQVMAAERHGCNTLNDANIREASAILVGLAPTTIFQGSARIRAASCHSR